MERGDAEKGISLQPLLRSYEWISRRDCVEHSVYLSLGSNLGDRIRNLEHAISALREASVDVQRISSMYETEPVDYLEQPWFLNLAVRAKTDLAPAALLRTLRQVEAQLGSKKLIAKGPRLIDIDILLYDDVVVDTPELQIPHPRMHRRRFVLEPLAEIAPNALHPLMGLSVSEMLATTRDKSAVRRVDPR